MFISVYVISNINNVFKLYTYFSIYIIKWCDIFGNMLTIINNNSYVCIAEIKKQN